MRCETPPALGVVLALLAAGGLAIALVTARSIANRFGPRARPESAAARVATATAARFVPIPLVGPLVLRALDALVVRVTRWRATRRSRTNAPCPPSTPG